MIEDYDDLNREQTLEAVRGFSGERLREFIAFERERKNRKTVVEPLERELVTVTPAVPRRYIAGLWFDDLDDHELVRRNYRVEQAINRGELEVVG